MGTLDNRHTGIGMTSDRTRARMVERLRDDGIRDEVVLEAMNVVPRHIFVDEALAIRAYEDSPLPIGHGQTISQPWVVARMSELARNGRALGDVLEIGTVALKHGDGTSDLGEELAVDAIVITAGATHVPEALLRFLKPGARMVLPLARGGAAGGDGERGTQRLTVIEPALQGYKEETLDAVRFVPLLPGIT